MAVWILQPAGEGRPPQSRRGQQQGASVGSGSRRAPKSRWTADASVGQGLGWRRNREGWGGVGQGSGRPGTHVQNGKFCRLEHTTQQPFVLDNGLILTKLRDSCTKGHVLPVGSNSSSLPFVDHPSVICF
jgi:hypothetical protein